MIAKAGIVFRGIIYSGSNHEEILKTNRKRFAGAGGRQLRYGFVDETGMFWDRKSAATIVLQNKQIEKLHFHMTHLFCGDFPNGTVSTSKPVKKPAVSH